MSFNEEMYEIMSWLSTKPLYRLLTMAKSTLEYLSETHFAKKQSHNSCMKAEESLIIQEDSSLRERVQKLRVCFLPENRSYNDVPKDFIMFLVEKGRILASNNGLFLCRTIDSSVPTELFLCNPSTRTWLPLKLPSEELAKIFQDNGELKVALVCGNVFGKKSENFPLDCTLLLFNEHDLEDWNSGYDVYMLEEGEWILISENIKTKGGDLEFDYQVCCEDGLYILAEGCSPHVFHYDVENRTSRDIALPEYNEEFGYLDIGCFRVFGWERKEGNSWFDSICLVKCFDNLITIWVLEHNTTLSKEKKSSSWRWLSNIHIEDDLCIEDSRWTDSFTILEKQLIFADLDGNIYRYYLEGKDYGNLDKIYEYGYSSSLKL
ncbi:uncharacterized protein LOC110701585 [Chenopodium quinoa]|uniref:uncharacterized protein LOC110701585 n=1 Tax=Chenopodium quinoa TaxID=63459 RepID=UPI000B78BEDB|nr:uncharacterized protein LOC110701585 [Chenopodium quinoa]